MARVRKSTRRLNWMLGAAAVGVAGHGGVAAAQTFFWTGPGGTSNAPTTGTWNNPLNVWDTDGDGVADVNTISSSAENVLSFGGTGTTGITYTSSANVNGDFLLNRIIDANAARTSANAATADNVNATGGTNARLVFVPNGAGVGPTISISGGANLTISLPVLLNHTLTINGTSTGGLVQFASSATISGTSGVNIAGNADQTRADFNGTNNPFSGGVRLTRGQAVIGANSTQNVAGAVTGGPLGTGVFVIDNQGSAGAALVRSSTGSNRNLGNVVTLAGNLTIGANVGTNNGNLTFSGPVTIVGATRTLDVRGQFTPPGGTLTNSDQTFSNAIGQDAAGRGLTKVGQGTLVFSGTNGNAYDGPTTVNGGILSLAKTGGATAINGNLIVGDNSTSSNLGGANDDVQWRASNQITDAAAITLNRGLLDLNGNSEGSTIAEGVGTLTSQNASQIDFGAVAAANVLHYADSASTSGSWSGTLSILNWNGATNGGGLDQLLFGSSDAALTAAQLTKIKFVNPAGLDPGTYNAEILSNGEVVASVPEPAGLALALLGGVGLLRRRRVKR